MKWDSPRVHQLVKDNIRSLCRHFFPQGKEIGHEWAVGNVTGDPGDSLKIELDDPVKKELFKDWATGDKGTFLDLLKRSRGWSLDQAIKEVCTVLGVPYETLLIGGGVNPADQYKSTRTAQGSVPGNGTSQASGAQQNAPGSNPVIDWSPYKLTHPNQLKELEAFRGYPLEFCRWVADKDCIGRKGPNWCTPDIINGQLVGIHKRYKNKKGEWDWVHEPGGNGTPPLIVGDLADADHVIYTESTWDSFSGVSVLGIHYGENVAAICTRSCTNAKSLAGIQLKPGAKLYAIPQNDQPGQDWLDESARIRPFKHVPVPPQFKDLNEWMQKGGPDAPKEFVAAFNAAKDYKAAAPAFNVQSQPGNNFPKIDWQDLADKRNQQTDCFMQEAIYPKESIIETFIENCRSRVECPDIYLLGAIQPMIAAVLARKVHTPWVSPKLFPNIYSMLAGTTGMQKSPPILLAKETVKLLLHSNSFLPGMMSAEGLFEQYYQPEGGRPDKVLVVPEANILMSTWTKSDYGARVASQFLDLYDCGSLDDHFLKSKKKQAGSAARTVPQTSTSALLGGTFNVAIFPVEQIRQGIQRRFSFQVSEKLARTILWPSRGNLDDVTNAFKPLVNMKGEITIENDQCTAWKFWKDYQEKNRKLREDVGRDNEALKARLLTAPTNVLKIAMIYEAAIAAHKNLKSIRTFSLEALELAAGCVEQHLRAGLFLDAYGSRNAIRERAEIILAKIQKEFPAQRPDAVYLTRTELTSRFCHDSSRRGAIPPDDLYLRIIPLLESQGEACLALKRGKYEVYAFRTDFASITP